MSTALTLAKKKVFMGTARTGQTEAHRAVALAPATAIVPAAMNFADFFIVLLILTVNNLVLYLLHIIREQ